ncbi:GAF domain-containing protein [Enhygromyxa salina]|uniref:GAF domain protein n=1 Tax=Enhygromyxa salina TaxID=215803 RepID=A0A2S9XWU5_9BACT|nr:GAF domain-containing protein [Enhygromyxa salina]PRP97322.1 GAF domain protein [Enhygromyxa salina]
MSTHHDLARAQLDPIARAAPPRLVCDRSCCERPSHPLLDRARIRELAALRLGEAVADPNIQALVDRVANELQLPFAAVSIVLDATPYFIVSHGLERWRGVARGSPLEWPLCRQAIDSKVAVAIEDASTHPAVCDNPLVRIDGIRSYLGIPLITSKRHAIGTLCVFGRQPRRFLVLEIARLHELARRVTSELETRRIQR